MSLRCSRGLSLASREREATPACGGECEARCDINGLMSYVFSVDCSLKALSSVIYILVLVT